MKNGPYISCIKVGGQPILPPLITPKLKQECLEYKRKALELEKKLERNKLFTKCMADLNVLQNQTEKLIKQQDESDENSFAARKTELQSTLNENPPKKVHYLTSETIDVTEYNDHGVKLFDSCTQDTPKLIRSNSYILESPSPILLAHLEKEAQKCMSEDSFNEDSIKSCSPVTIIDSEMAAPEIVETDVTIEQVTITTPVNIMENKSEIDSQLLSVLKKLPDEHARNILDLLEKQQEQFKAYRHFGDSILNDVMRTREENNCSVGSEKPSSISVSSQSLHYSVSNLSNTPQPTLTMPRSPEEVVNLKNRRNCAKRELVFDNERKKEWAANIICANARGFLVRRLMKTEKVRNLIGTIQDALLCAIELHSSENIEESDVELHRRLLQQVQAACVAFHDIFFALSTNEQMVIIALDRQRRIEKANRPLSSRSSRTSTTGRLHTARIS